MASNIIAPEVQQEVERAHTAQEEKIYRMVRDRWNPEIRIENVRLEHDPDWDKRWCSIQGHGDAARQFIKITTFPLTESIKLAENIVFWTGFYLATPTPIAPQQLKSLPPRIKLART